MRSGGNNFNYFPENQLTKFSAVLQLGGHVPTQAPLKAATVPGPQPYRTLHSSSESRTWQKLECCFMTELGKN